MNMFCGDMGCDLWSRSNWEKHFSENMVIVCTAEVLYQCLMHSFITMDQINLLIFDEAHHAKKNHSYARIIKDFYSQPEQKRNQPKIFGMTASPVDARVDVRKAAAELEGLLQCEIATAADASLLQYSTLKTRTEMTTEYDTLEPKFKTPLFRQMEEYLKYNRVFKKPLTYAYEIASRELGAWCADQIWPLVMNEEEVKKLQAKTKRQHNMRRIPEPLQILEEHEKKLLEAEAIVKDHHFEIPQFSHSLASSTNLSSKVVLLIKYLRERFERPTEDKCIVFVKQRYTASLLAKLCSHPNIATKYLKVGTLVCQPPTSLSDCSFHPVWSAHLL